jgi:hypothetical protein
MDNYYYDPYNGNFSFDDMYDSYYLDDVYGGSYSWNFSYYYDLYGQHIYDYDEYDYKKYHGLDAYNHTWGSYSNYVYDPYGNYTMSPYNRSFEFAPNGGNWSWNYTNIGYWNDAYGNEQWYYKLIDNSYFCLMYGQ